MLVPQLLLETLEDLSKDDFDKFKWYLGLNILKNCEQIPLYQLGSPFRHNIVSKMIESNGEEKAVNSTVEILKMMKHNYAAERLKKTYTEGAAAQEKVSLAVGRFMLLNTAKVPLLSKELNIQLLVPVRGQPRRSDISP